MQSLIQATSETTAPTHQPLDMGIEAPPARYAQEEEEEEGGSAASTETDAVIRQQNEAGMQTAEPPATVEETDTGDLLQNELSENPAEAVKVDSALKTSTPVECGTNMTSPSGGQKAKKPDKGGKDGRKYVPSKKAMIDPLKMDISKPVVMPLTSSQLSLQCIECHIIFSDHKSKERHLKASHPAEYEQCILRNALFACYVCDSQFTNSTELMAHQKTHLERKPFKCPICSVAFKKSSELTGHKKIHFGQGGYACTDCGKPCRTLTLLKYHQRTHTGEMPYVCKECGKRFTLSKALQKHLVSHMPEGPEKEERIAAFKKRPKKCDGTVKYLCYICKGIFKTPKTRRHHMKSKHNMVPANNTSSARQVKQSTPIITPISISQPGLLQVEPNGPLQKVDSNIDTEQIRRLIESLGNVQKVNQVVILGQVPPNAPPLEVQQLPHPAEPAISSPPQIDFIGLKQPDSGTAELDASNNQFDPMEQTIILEPITPDGQLLNAPFSEFGSHIGTAESIELTLVQTEQAERPVGEVMHEMLHQTEVGEPQSDSVNQMVCQNALTDDLEQTVILELTPALMPTLELEQSMPQHEIPSSIVPSTEFQKTPDSTELNVQEPGLSVPDLMTTVELELTPLETEQEVVTSCPFDPPDTFTETPKESEINNKEDEDSGAQKESMDQIPNVMEGDAPLESSEQEPIEQVTSEKLQAVQKEDREQLSEAEDTSAERQVPCQSEGQQDPKLSESPVNVMSAQELVKVRKRKPARTLIYQSYLQESVRSIHKKDLQMELKPAKRQRTRKSHLVVKFGPPSKEKKSKKQKKPSPLPPPPVQEKEITANLSPKKAAAQKKGRKGKNEKKGAHLVSTAEMKLPSSTPEPQPLKSHARRSKMKKKKEEAREVMKISGHKSAASPGLKKKKPTNIMQMNQPKAAKDGEKEKKRKINPKTKKDDTKTGPISADTQAANVTQDSLLLLKGHKQPQLKVYKLDPAKASGQTQGASPQQSKDVNHPAGNDLGAGSQKKGGRTKKNQKGLSLLSSLQISHQTPETLPTKPKTTRKRKASSKVETEGVITSSHSKRALDCPDCGERFSELSTLQKHKATAHVVESPGLTYTNGNIFEGVSRLNLYQLPKQHGDNVVGALNTATGWDTEPEMAEISLEDRERTVSFPALIPSPSLPLPPPDVEMSIYGDKRGSDGGADDHHQEVSSLSDQPKNNDAPSEPALETLSKTKVLEMGEPLSSDELEKGSESEVQAHMDEDIKEDLLLEVDLVTVGEQNEREDSASSQEIVAQDELTGNSDCGSTETSTATGKVCESTEKQMMSHTVSCSTRQVEIKEEHEEILVQRKKVRGKGAGTKNATRGRGRGTKRGARAKTVSGEDTPRGTESEKDECEVDYEKHPITSDSDLENGSKTLQSAPSAACEANKASAPVPSASEQPPEEQVVLEQESVTASVEETRNEGEEHDRETGQSPVIILEKILTSKPTEVVDKEPCGEAIKVEETISDPLLVAASGQNKQNLNVQHRGIRTVLVKAESSSSRHIRWNVESLDSDSTATPLMQSLEAANSDCGVTAEFSTNQCIFYPVKEEDREVLLGSTQINCEGLTPERSTAARETELPNADDAPYNASHTTQDCLETRVRRVFAEPGINDFAHGQAEAESERSHQPDLRDFLLRSCDEEDGGGFELSNPQMDSEAEVLAYFYKKKSSGTRLLEQASPSSSSSTNQIQTPRGEIRPIDYFSRYFSWDAWVEIAKCTNEQSSVPNPVTAREVAQFVGIHIAMGTLKFPSPKLYWEDLTKVPLIAEAMPLLRFLKLTQALKFASSAKDPVNSTVQTGRQDGEIQTRQRGKTLTGRQCAISQQSQRDELNDSNRSETQTDPLWKVQPFLSRFQVGCQSLRREGDYAVDQYLIPLTGKQHNNNASLHCTTLIGFGGLLLHVDFKLNLSDKEDAVEKMVPKGSMVFLCKQELSTPAMLERLLAAGVHGAGRVVGARGQIGDDFVSSDGKLMLRRSHCGFILSTAGSCQRNMASLIDNFEQAQMSARLNRDLRNLYPIPLTASLPTCWPQTILWYLTDQALVNSWLLYRRDRPAPAATLTLMDFRLEVSKALILSSGSDTQDSVPPQPPREKVQSTSQTFNPSPLEESPLPDAATRYDGSGHWPEQLAEGEGGRCRYGDCQRTSRVLCLKCCVFLCISRNHNCFLNFHNQGSFGKE